MIMIAAALTAAVLAPAASASTVAIEDGVVVVRGTGTESNYFLISIEQRDDLGGPRMQISDSDNVISYPEGPCAKVEYDERVYCTFTSKGVRVEAGAGNDFVSMWSDWDSALPVTVYGGEGKDKIQDQSYNEAAVNVKKYFDGGPGDDVINGYNGEDVLIGGDGNDDLDGGAGVDELRGGEGNDHLWGDHYELEWAGDILDGGPGTDEGDEWNIPSEDNNPPVTITQDGIANDGRAGENDNVISIEKIHSGAPSGTFNGTPGNDDVYITSRDDKRVINTFEGDDKIEGGYGTEIIDGGAGADAINGGYGHDTITGGPGPDVINGDGGAYCGYYTCSVPFGNDTIYARDGEVDQIECGVGEDTVVADAADVVSESCEKVDRGAGAGGSGGGAGAGGGAGSGAGGGGAAAAAVAFKLVGKASVKSGAAFSIVCASACEVRATLAYKGKVVGSGRKTALAAGTVKVPVKLSAKGKRALKRVKKAKLTLRVTIKDAAGKTTTFSTAITMKK
jgi:hypothetical protein